MKKAIEYISLTIAIIIMIAATLTYLAPHFGWRVDAVCSGSMEPAMKVGTLAVTRPIDPHDIEVGDIITFDPKGVTLSEFLVSHRVIEVRENSPLYFKTKGDANDNADPFIVPAANVVGKIDFHTPYLGYVTQFLRTPAGFLLALVIPGLLMITMYAISVQKMLRDKKLMSPHSVRLNEDEA